MRKLFALLFFLFVVKQNIAQPPVLTQRDSLAVRSYFFAGLSDRIREDFNQAEQNFRKAIAIDSNSDATYYELANLQVRQHQLFEAEQSIKKAVQLNAENIWYLRMLADVLKLNRKFEQLLPTLDKLITYYPNEERYYVDKIKVLLALGQQEEAEKILRTSEQQFNHSSQIQSLVKRTLGQARATQHETTDPTKTIDELLNLASQQLANRQLAAAESTLHKAKAVNAADYRIDLGFADVYQAQDNQAKYLASLTSVLENESMPLLAKITRIADLQSESNVVAEQLAKKLQEIYPRDERVLVLYGDILYQNKQIDGAILQYKKALQLSDGLYVAWEKLLSAQLLVAQFDEAIATSENALALYPNQAVLYYYRAFALHRKLRVAEAAFELRNAKQLMPDDTKLKAWIFALEAEINIDLGKLKEADASFANAIALMPNNYPLQSNYAYFLALRNQNLTKALQLAASAAKAMPNDASILDSYAFVLFKNKAYPQALKIIEQALQNKGEQNSVYLEHYGDILFLNGFSDKAVEAWKKALLYGNNTEKIIKKINEKKYIK
jgi:tetratricopeptide (TPR) repeat protein